MILKRVNKKEVRKALNCFSDFFLIAIGKIQIKVPFPLAYSASRATNIEAGV